MIFNSKGHFINTGNGPSLLPVDIGHKNYLALVDPDTAFWLLVKRNRLADVLSDASYRKAYIGKLDEFRKEMEALRFTRRPSAVYFNPTEKCNLNCSYCYIPGNMRRNGHSMSSKELFEALEQLKSYFSRTLPTGTFPQIIFHGAEPLLNREAVFAGIDKYGKDFQFGIQTNATFLDEQTVEFLTSRNVSIGMSLDGPTSAVDSRTRHNWSGESTYKKTAEAMERLKGYTSWNIISTITRENMHHLVSLAEFFHSHEVPGCMLNIVRGTMPSSREVKPSDADAVKHYLAAMDRTYKLYQKTGKKLVVSNFANVLLAIIAPTARRLMCDISPCGGGRFFFALSANGDLFPCSEFVGLPAFKGGNIFKDDIEDVLVSSPFSIVAGRKVEDIEPCSRCAIRNFCGAPCPAEVHAMHGRMDKTGAFCEFYEEQTRYAFRVIADGRQDAFLWDDWDKGTKDTFTLNHSHKPHYL
ncbi:MAG: peptide-modifying radical SAM enzyme CbpB [Deltaproteobacteria bacterium]|nr:peptide-modifying radical SAM enzyme CbpB [Deltaproteobacteria bacterium]MCL5793087.1 peptide-modifying radical SAM enzyme CbpB [Deltaproteobacteria bacterium]